MYIQTSGALGFTQAQVPTGALLGGFEAFEEGEFLVTGTRGWMVYLTCADV